MLWPLDRAFKVKQSIKFKPGLIQPAFQNQTLASTLSSTLEFDVIQIVDKTIAIDDAMRQLRDSGIYEYVEPDFAVNLDLVANDP